MRLTRSKVHLDVDGRGVTIDGEMLVPMEGQPDFVVFSGMMKNWDDGDPISADDKQRILDQIRGEAEAQGVRIAID